MKKALAKKMEEFEMTKKARLQIDRYKRQYKIMEGSRLAYNEELSIQLEKHRLVGLRKKTNKPSYFMLCYY